MTSERIRVAVISDIDGTLVESRALPTAATIAAVAWLSSDHIPLLLASGRPPGSVRRLFTHLGVQVPFVASNGNYLDDLVHCPELMVPFSHEMVDECLQLAADNSAHAVFAKIEDINVCVDPAPWLCELLYEYDEPECETVTSADLHSTISSITHCHLVRQAGWDRKPSAIYGAIVGSEAEYLTVTPRGIDKAVGVTKLIGDSADICVVIGDGENDLALFKLPNALRVAISGAHPTLIESADCVAPTASEDGFAWIVYNLVRPIVRREIQL